MTTLEGFPSKVATADLEKSAVTLTVDAAVYPLEALYGAAYVFIDRCFVFVDRPDAARFTVTLAAKKPPADDALLRALAGEFANELLSCAYRHQVTQENRAIIEAVTMQAISGAMGPPSLDELASFDFTEETFEDPLGIAMSWEDKYKKPKEAGAKADETARASGVGATDAAGDAAAASHGGADAPAAATAAATTATATGTDEAKP